MVLPPLSDTPYVGFYCVNAFGKTICCHSMLSSYPCSIPKAKDLTSIKDGNARDRLCFRCYVSTNRLNGLSN